MLYPIQIQSVYAYIGPGAGFAFVGSAFVFFIAFLMAFITIAFWPMRFIWKIILGKKISKNAKTHRIVVIGLDGLDPTLTSKYMNEGSLPNLKSISEKGTYTKLGTTYPSISPVAWSTFQTGVNPGAHNIFDFLTRDKRYCLPILSSSHIETSKKNVYLGKYKIPLGKPEMTILRKSQPFWKVLGKSGIFSNILRVPISFPPEKFYGNTLSAMCTPDLKGSQGTFSLYSTLCKKEEKKVGGKQIKVKIYDNKINSYVEGPLNPILNKKNVMRIPFSIKLLRDKDEAILFINNEKINLKLDEFTDWIKIEFKAGLGVKVAGICRFCLRKIQPNFELYVSPINIDPENPALPVSYPKNYSIYLSKLNGLFGTLGLMEDTWALNEKALDDATFLKQTYLTHDEREKMFFDAIDKTKEGLAICVFDASDRIQHMFWRYIDDKHPAPKQNIDIFKNAIPQMYKKMDILVGKVKKKLGKKDVLIVMSDHGFKSFRRCININTWLMQNGYLALNNNKPTGLDYFQDVDWSKTKAFAVGLGGIYLNRKGREARGIVDQKDVEKIKTDIIRKLTGLKDPADGSVSIRKVYDTKKIYRGIYKDEAPDLIVGYEDGYRVSWESVTGKIKPDLFEDNLKAWSGDHGVDTMIVDGVLFCNKKIKKDNPNIIDMAPSILDLFGVDIPKYMEGKVLF